MFIIANAIGGGDSTGSVNTINTGGGVEMVAAPTPIGGWQFNTQYYTPSVTAASASSNTQTQPLGDRPPYTPLDFPLMHELRPGEQLERLNPQSGLAQGSILPYLALGVLAALLLK